MPKKKVLTISILISKRPDTVRKCLDSVKPILDAIDAELILTDTGCGEEVRNIIEEYTDQIIEFEWCKDFSKARNVGLKQAKGEWFLFLDDDEWFDDVSDIIHFFKSGEYKNYGLATYYQRNYLDEAGKDYEDLLVGRTIKLEEDIHFEYAIHECFNRVPGKTKVLNAFVHHYGYVYKTEAERMAHSERNISLLLIEHEKDPYNLKHILQLIQEYNSLEKWDDSLALALKGIECDKQGKATQHFCRNSLYANVINCYMHKKDYEKIIQVGSEYLKTAKLDDLAKAAIYFRLAPAYFENDDFEQALEAVKEYWRRYEYQKANPEDYLPYVTNITASAFRLGYLNILICVAVRSCLALKDYRQAKQWLKRLEPDNDELKILEDVAKDIIDLLPGAQGEAHEILLDMGNLLIGTQRGIENRMIGCIEEKCFEVKEGKEQFLLHYAKLASDSPFFVMIRLIKEMIEKQDHEQIEKQLRQLCQTALPLCFRSLVVYRVWEKAKALGLDLASIIRDIPYSSWDKTMMGYCLKGFVEERERINQWLIGLLSTEEIHFLSWNKAYRLALLMEKAEATQAATLERQEWKVLKVMVKEYVPDTLAYYRRIYRPEILERDPQIMPQEGVAAYYLAGWMEELEKKEYTRSVSLLKKLKDLAPGWNKVIQLLLKGIEWEMDSQSSGNSEAVSELLLLGEQLKKKAAEYMAKGEKQTAEMILTQLKTILPQDEEVDKMLTALSGGEV